MNTRDNEIYVDNAYLADAKEMLELNYKIYPPEWHVAEDYVEKVFAKNNEVYRVIRAKNSIKGVYSMFPLDKESYDLVLKGELQEDDLFNHILDYSTSKEVYLYFISIIVDIFDAERKTFAKKLILDIPERLNYIISRGIAIKEIGAIAISEDGERICPRIGLHNNDEEMIGYANKQYPVFRGSVEDVMQAIRK